MRLTANISLYAMFPCVPVRGELSAKSPSFHPQASGNTVRPDHSSDLLPALLRAERGTMKHEAFLSRSATGATHEMEPMSLDSCSAWRWSCGAIAGSNWRTQGLAADLVRLPGFPTSQRSCRRAPQLAELWPTVARPSPNSIKAFVRCSLGLTRLGCGYHGRALWLVLPR